MLLLQLLVILQKFKILISKLLLSPPLFLSVLLPYSCLPSEDVKDSETEKSLFLGRCVTSREVTVDKLKPSIQVLLL